MQVQRVSNPSVNGRNDHGAGIGVESHMADQGFIEDGMDQLGVVDATLWQALDLGPRCG